VALSCATAWEAWRGPPGLRPVRVPHSHLRWAKLQTRATLGGAGSSCWISRHTQTHHEELRGLRVADQTGLAADPRPLSVPEVGGRAPQFEAEAGAVRTSGDYGQAFQAQPVSLRMAPAEVLDQGASPFRLLPYPPPRVIGGEPAERRLCREEGVEPRVFPVVEGRQKGREGPTGIAQRARS